jgi:hypothetical protein
LSIRSGVDGRDVKERPSRVYSTSAWQDSLNLENFDKVYIFAFGIRKHIGQNNNLKIGQHIQKLCSPKGTTATVVNVGTFKVLIQRQ